MNVDLEALEHDTQFASWSDEVISCSPPRPALRSQCTGTQRLRASFKHLSKVIGTADSAANRTMGVTRTAWDRPKEWLRGRKLPSCQACRVVASGKGHVL